MRICANEFANSSIKKNEGVKREYIENQCLHYSNFKGQDWKALNDQQNAKVSFVKSVIFMGLMNKGFKYKSEQKKSVPKTILIYENTRIQKLFDYINVFSYSKTKRPNSAFEKNIYSDVNISLRSPKTRRKTSKVKILKNSTSKTPQRLIKTFYEENSKKLHFDIPPLSQNKSAITLNKTMFNNKKRRS